MVGARRERLLRRHDPLLVADAGARGADAGDDEEKPGPAFGAQRRDLVRRAHDAGKTRLLREAGEAARLVEDGSSLADAVEIALVEAGENGDGEELHLACGSLHG